MGHACDVVVVQHIQMTDAVTLCKIAEILLIAIALCRVAKTLPFAKYPMSNVQQMQIYPQLLVSVMQPTRSCPECLVQYIHPQLWRAVAIQGIIAAMFVLRPVGP